MAAECSKPAVAQSMCISWRTVGAIVQRFVADRDAGTADPELARNLKHSRHALWKNPEDLSRDTREWAHAGTMTGLVERQPDPADRRARKAVATRPGIETLRALQNKITSAEGIVAGRLGACRAEAVPVAAGPPGPPGQGRRRSQGPDCVRRQNMTEEIPHGRPNQSHPDHRHQRRRVREGRLPNRSVAG
ncbi:hypothetical protein SGPA1_10598 [Streptomyces misionensis JCM 4497]